MLLPQFNKIRIGDILELEKKIEETKDDFKRYQDITTNLLTQISTTNNFNNQNIIYNMPYKTKIDEKDLEKDKEIVNEDYSKLSSKDFKKPDETEEKIYNEEDLNIKLMILRRDLEINLKRYLNRQMRHEINSNKPIGLMRMVKIYLNQTNKDLYKPFLNVISVCNAAVHGENVDKLTANYVVDIGLSLIKQIKIDSL